MVVVLSLYNALLLVIGFAWFVINRFISVDLVIEFSV